LSHKVLEFGREQFIKFCFCFKQSDELRFEIITDIPLHGGVCHKITHVSAVFKSTSAFPLNTYATPGEDTCQEASSGKKNIYIYKKHVAYSCTRDPLMRTRHPLILHGEGAFAWGMGILHGE
jgi:hypothetical protein